MKSWQRSVSNYLRFYREFENVFPLQSDFPEATYDKNETNATKYGNALMDGADEVHQWQTE